MAPISSISSHLTGWHRLESAQPFVQTWNEAAAKISWQFGDPAQLNPSSQVDWSTAKVRHHYAHPLRKRSAPATLPNHHVPSRDEKPVSDTDEKGRSDFIFKGYEDILSAPYPTKGVKTFDDLLDRDSLREVIAKGARVLDPEVQEILAPVTEQLRRTTDPYERDQIMNMIWDTIEQGMLLGDLERAIKEEIKDQQEARGGGRMSPILEEYEE
jgi:hypothetical protein